MTNNRAVLVFNQSEVFIISSLESVMPEFESSLHSHQREFPSFKHDNATRENPQLTPWY